MLLPREDDKKKRKRRARKRNHRQEDLARTRTSGRSGSRSGPFHGRRRSTRFGSSGRRRLFLLCALGLWRSRAGVPYLTQITEYHAGKFSCQALYTDVPKGLRRLGIKFYVAAAPNVKSQIGVTLMNKVWVQTTLGAGRQLVAVLDRHFENELGKIAIRVGNSVISLQCGRMWALTSHLGKSPFYLL